MPVPPSAPAEIVMLEMDSTVKLSGVLPDATFDATFDAWVAVGAPVAVAAAVAVAGVVGVNVALESAVNVFP
ncbi:MAG TPA: hypothetical protein VF792_12465 [Ktedonobacterales bacterium]